MQMPKKSQKKKGKSIPEPLPKDFLDMIAPAAVKFNTDHFILGNAYHCVMAVRGYSTITEELALLSHLGERSNVNITIYTRRVTGTEEQKIIQNASNRSRFERSNTNDMKQSVTAEANLQDVAALVTAMHRNREPLDHSAVYLDLAAKDLESLRTLRDEVTSELVRAKIAVDRLLLKQREGFLCANPAGRNVLGTQFERVLPASSVANLYPNNYSGKTDPQGFYIGKDKYGSNIIVDLDRRAEDKTNASMLIFGNSGQGKSFLLKLLVWEYIGAVLGVRSCVAWTEWAAEYFGVPQRRRRIFAVTDFAGFRPIQILFGQDCLPGYHLVIILWDTLGNGMFYLLPLRIAGFLSSCYHMDLRYEIYS